MPPEYKAKILAGRPRFEAMARERYGVSINPGPFGFNSRPALIGEKIAESQSLLHAYHDAVMAAYWQNAVDIGRIENLAAIAESVGINRNDFLNALSAETYAKPSIRTFSLPAKTDLTASQHLYLKIATSSLAHNRLRPCDKSLMRFSQILQ